MRRQRRGLKLLALIMGLSLVAGACGSDDDEGSDDGSDEAAQEEGVQGGELVDLRHVRPGARPSTSIRASTPPPMVGRSADPSTTASPRPTSAIPTTPRRCRCVAESWEVNDDATESTSRSATDLAFSDGEEVLPSSFVRGWERASDPDFAGDYSYLFTFIEGGAEKLDGAADTISGVEADDEAMTLTVDAVGAVRQLPRRGRLPDLHADAVGGRRAHRSGRVGARRHDRQRPVRHVGARERSADRARAQPRVGRDQVRRGARPARAALPRQADLHDRVGHRHGLQRVRGRRGRRHQLRSWSLPGGAGQLVDHHRHAVPGRLLLHVQRP